MSAISTLPLPQLQRRWKSLPGEPVGDAGDAYTGYDRFGRVERMRWGKLGDGGSFTPLVDVSWGHSPASQKTCRKDLLAPPSTAQDQKFDYDALYQLTQRQRGVLNVNLTSAGGVPAQQEDFDYDETGNWKGYRQQAGGTTEIDQTRVNNKSNQITQIDGSSAGISYDQNGNMLTAPTGEALTNPSHRIVWDGWNRPVKVYDSADNLLAEYRYDGLGRRVTVASGGVTRHTYYDDQWRSIEERLDASTTAERQHVWHPADRWEMILRDRSTANNGVMDERLYPMKDQLDPVAIADDAGTVVGRFSYTAFGIPTFLDSSFNPQAPTHAWHFLFHAEFQDAETGWFNYGYRYYVPELGRWLNRDLIEEEGGINLYGYLGNQPFSDTDYLGMIEYKLKVILEYLDKNPADMKSYGDSSAYESSLGFDCKCDLKTKRATINYSMNAVIQMRIRNWAEAIKVMELGWNAPQTVAGQQYKAQAYIIAHEKAHAANFKKQLKDYADKLGEKESKDFETMTDCLVAGLDAVESFKDFLKTISKYDNRIPSGKAGIQGSGHMPGWDSNGLIDQIDQTIGSPK